MAKMTGDLTPAQIKLVEGMAEALKLYNDLRERLTNSDMGIKVDALAYAGGRMTATIIRDVRNVEIDL